MQSSPLDVTQDARSAAALMAPPPRAPAPAPAPASRMRAAAARPAAAAPPPPASRRAPPPLPSSPMAPPSMSLAKRLTLAFEGRTYAVDKEHFIIGRSKTQADLRIDDPNVSRQHASIERIGSIYYLVDLGSTNGVYVADDKVTRRALADGDVIVVTTHRIHCTLR